MNMISWFSTSKKKKSLSLDFSGSASLPSVTSFCGQPLLSQGNNITTEHKVRLCAERPIALLMKVWSSGLSEVFHISVVVAMRTGD